MSFADRDGYIWMDGVLKDWRDSNTHFLTHSLHYGLSVFEGVRAYNTVKNGTCVFRLKDHTRRLFDSAKILQLEIPYSEDEINRIVVKAETGEVRNLNDNYLQLVLKNGNRYEDLNPSSASEKQKYPHSKASFDEYILNIEISDFNNVNLDEENYKSTYKMQKIYQLKTNSDTLKTKFDEDMEMFGENFLIGHTLRKLPNLNLNQIGATVLLMTFIMSIVHLTF